MIVSGGSGISCWGANLFWGADLQRGCLFTKKYVKTKELGPVGGCALGTPPKSADESYIHFDAKRSLNSLVHLKVSNQEIEPGHRYD